MGALYNDKSAADNNVVPDSHQNERANRTATVSYRNIIVFYLFCFGCFFSNFKKLHYFSSFYGFLLSLNPPWKSHEEEWKKQELVLRKCCAMT